MSPHVEANLWAFTTGDLDRGDMRMTELHLEDCPECRDRLAEVKAARRTLTLSRSVLPLVQTEDVDARLGRFIDAGLLASVDRFSSLRKCAAVTFVGCLAALLWLSPRRPVTAHLSALVSSLHPQFAAAQLGGATTLERPPAPATTIEPQLERRRLLVTVSSREREPFVMRLASGRLEAVSAVFFIGQIADGLEVGVAQGIVRLRLDDKSFEVGSGELLSVDSRHRVLRRDLPRATAEELGTFEGRARSNLNETIAPRTSTTLRASAETAAKAMFVPSGVASSPARAGRLPRLSATAAASRRRVLPPEVWRKAAVAEHSSAGDPEPSSFGPAPSSTQLNSALDD
jgi:hypothetical protein